MNLFAIAEYLGLEKPDQDRDIQGIMPITEAAHTHITFLENPKYLRDLEKSDAGAVLIDEKFADRLPQGCIPLFTPEAHLKMAELSHHFVRPLIAKEGKEPVVGENCTIMPHVHIGKNCIIGDNVILMHGCYVGDNVTIGNDVVIHPNVVLYNDTQIGARTILQAGVIIGGDGFGYAHTKMGEHIKIHHIGNCILEEDVEVGANSTIDRAVFGSTRIKKGTKIDNLVQIGHNCELGENVIIVGQAGMAGSCKIGRNVILGGQVAVRDHVTIGDFAILGGRSGVSKDIEGHKTYSGYPLMEHKKWLKLQARINKLLDT